MGQHPHLPGRRGLLRRWGQLLDEDAVCARRAGGHRGPHPDDPLLAGRQRQQAGEEDDVAGRGEQHLAGRILGPGEGVELEAQGLAARVLDGEDRAPRLARQEDLDRVDREVGGARRPGPDHSPRPQQQERRDQEARSCSAARCWVSGLHSGVSP
jgi:hypothetical protein